MIVAQGLPLNVANIIFSCIFSILFRDFRACGPISISTPPVVYPRFMRFNERTKHFFIKKYISHFILERGPQFVVSWEIDGETYTQIGVFFFPISSSESQWVPTLVPPCKPCRQRRLCLAACPSLDSWFSALCLNLTAWLPRGLLPVTHLLNPSVLMRCHFPV